MKRILSLVILSVLFAGCALGQVLIPIKFISEDDNRLLSENDSVRFYAATDDTLNIVAINEDALFYRLVNRRDHKRVVAEGGIIADGEGYLQHGRWQQFSANGKPAISGTYLKGKPAGNWEEYHLNGRLKATYQYALVTDKDGTNTCISGEYREYYNTGRLKVCGFYTADRNRTRDTLSVEDPVSGNKVNKTLFRSVYTPRKAGFWEYFSESGESEKREEY
jgi:antitoxin component YwqK of YwqJK toxin-antitoxin module